MDSSRFERILRLPRNVVADILHQEIVQEEDQQNRAGYMWFLDAQSMIALNFFFHLSGLGVCSESDRAQDALDRDNLLWCRIVPFLDPQHNDRQIWSAFRHDPAEICVDYLCVISTELQDCSSLETSFSTSTTPLFASSPSVDASEARDKPPEIETVLLYIEHTKPKAHWEWEIPFTSMNRARMSLVAGITHLASLGVVEFPLFAIATDGCIGTVLCAWCGPITLHDGEIQSVCLHSLSLIRLYIFMANF